MLLTYIGYAATERHNLDIRVIHVFELWNILTHHLPTITVSNLLQHLLAEYIYLTPSSGSFRDIEKSFSTMLILVDDDGVVLRRVLV